MNIKFLDLKSQYTSIKMEIDEAVSRVIEKQSFILGDEVEHFEREYADYLGVKYFIGVASGTEGLQLSMWALGFGKGDEVIVPVNSFVATALAVTQVGATPIFVDIDEQTYQIDSNQVEKKITKKTKAILPVHLYGSPSNLKELKRIAKREKIYLIEDAAQAHGTMFENKKVGGFGDLGVFSFYPGKNLGAYGDGGGIATNNKNLYELLFKLRNYGQAKKYYHDIIGINSRLDEIQAAILRVKLRHLDLWNEKRRQKADMYNELLSEFKTQKMYPNSLSCYHLFVIEHAKREKLRVYLEEKGVQTLIHYPLPISLQKCYNYLGYNIGDFPKAEKISKQIFSLPIYAELTDKEITYIANIINTYPQS